MILELQRRIRARLRDERGAVAVLTAISMVFLITATALSVDVGHVVSSERFLEKTVDLAALDTVRTLEDALNSPTGFPGGADPETALTAAAKESASRNNFDADDTAAGNSIAVEVGISDAISKVFTAVPFAAWTTANAVRVNGTHTQDYSFVPGATALNEFGIARLNLKDDVINLDPCVGYCGGDGDEDGEGNPCVGSCGAPNPCEGVAECLPPLDCTDDSTYCDVPCPQGSTDCDPDNDCPGCVCVPGTPSCPNIEKSDPVAAISVGSTLGTFDSRESFMDPFLGEMLGTSVDISAAGYDGLAVANVTLGQLWSELGIDAGSPEEVLNSSVSVANLVDATIDALNQNGDPYSLAAATALSTFSGSIDPSLEVTFGELVDFGMGQPGMAAGATINALDLLTIAAEVANGDNLISFTMPLTIPGVSSTRVTLAIIEAPRVAVGPPGYDDNGRYLTVARTAQARMFIEAELTDSISIGGAAHPLRMPIYIEAGQARTALHTVDCDVLKDNCVTGTISASDAAGIYFNDVNTSLMVDGSQAVPLLPGRVTEVGAAVTITGTGNMTVAGATKASTFNGPHTNATGSFLRKDHMGATEVSLDALRTALDLDVSGVLTVVGAVAESQASLAMSPVFDELESKLLTPLMQTPLGITIGGADIVNNDTLCTYTTLVGG